MRFYGGGGGGGGGGVGGDGNTPGYCVFYRLSSAVQECKGTLNVQPLINDLDIVTLMDPLANTVIHTLGYTDCTMIQN